MRNRGFTLIELLVAVVIIGIVLGIAAPSYMSHLTASRRAEAQSTLISWASAYERHYTSNGTYAGADLDAPYDSDPAMYTFTEESATATGFVLRATPVEDTTQDGDGYLEYTSTGERRWDRDDDGNIASDGSESCWAKSCS